MLNHVDISRRAKGGKRAILKAAAPGLLIAFLSLVVPAGLYADTGTWVDGDMPVLSVDAVSTQYPQGLNPCFKTGYSYLTYGTNPHSVGQVINATGCEAQNEMGSFINSNADNTGDSYDFIKPGTSIAFRVLHPGGRAIAISPVPNQGSFMWMEPSSYWGNPVAPHFFTNFASAGDFGQYSYGSNIVPFDLAYELNTTGTVLTDSAGTKIYIKSYAFSQNGEWMAAEAYGLGLIRVNTQSLSMQLFSQDKFAYNLGFSPSVTLAISDDGNSVIKSGFNAGDTKVYDLSGCQPSPFTLNVDNSSATVGCRSRYVQQSLQAQLTTFQFMTDMHFSADGKSATAVAISTGLNGIRLYNRVHYSIAGYQAPHVSYLALGDSFSSGEGAFSYVPGTDSDNPLNKCHLSTLSYPYLTAQALGLMNDFHSVACSGAQYDPHYTAKAQFDNDPNFSWLPGEEKQHTFVAMSKPDVVTVSMIGNDVGFKDKLTTCIVGPDDCFHFKEDREAIANEFRGKFDDLVALYKDIKDSSGNSDVKVYVLGYPQILGTDACQLNVRFSLEEREMAQGMVSYLNAVIKAATISAGVQYIDVEHAFDGYRLCDTHTSDPFSLSAAAVNGLIRGNDFGPIGNGSFHPNALGHQLMSGALLTQSQSFTKSMPAPDPSTIAPYVGSDAYNNLIGGAPSANFSGMLLYTSPTTTVTRATMTGASIVQAGRSVHLTETQLYLQSNSQFLVWFHSNPVLAGTLTTDSAGHLNGDITAPADLSPGFHTMHVIGKDIGGGDIDMYQVIYVAASLDDYNGDGVLNSEDPCLIIPPSGIDSDHDGIDDACDGNITPTSADTVPPQVTGTVDRQPDHSGWYSRDATISWSANDPDPSSGNPTLPASTLANLEGDNIYTSNESCDPAGNCARGSLELKLDKTSPEITYAVDPMPNAAGWNHGTAVVHFTCTDALSGVESCTEPITVSDSDGSYVITGTASDSAGNTSNVNVVVNIDATAPDVTNILSSQPNQYGWYNHDVTITPSCSDNLSGVAGCSQPVTITQEGASQDITSSAIDYAGNTASATATVNLDKTAPEIHSLTWTNNPKATLGTATLSVGVSDNLSGVRAAEYFLGDADPGAGHGVVMQHVEDNFIATFNSDLPTGVYKVSLRVQDVAGNWSAASSDYLVVYNPFSIRMIGKKSFTPSLTNGDNLPGLTDSAQTDAATFAFSVGYDRSGDPLSNSRLHFDYETGTDCKQLDRSRSCHNFRLDATSVEWFTTSGANNSSGVFAGDALLVVDGTTQQVKFVLTGLDGDRLDDKADDHITLQIFNFGDNPASAKPLYLINDDVTRGNIHIQT